MPKTQFPLNFPLPNLDGKNGFLIDVGCCNIFASGGNILDFNGDGVTDIVLQAYSKTYIIFGNSTVGSTGLIDVTTLNGKNGFLITGLTGQYATATQYAAGAGDVNGDGLGDIVIGAPDVANQAGASYLIFGKSGIGGGSATLNIPVVNATYGLTITGIKAGDKSGSTVGSAGDINDDGYADFFITATTEIGEFPQPQEAYIIFGKSDIGVNGSLSLSSLNGQNGFTIPNMNGPISSAGDVNADGIEDLIIGNPNPYINPLSHNPVINSYVLFGRKNIGSSGSFNLASINGTNGFTIGDIMSNDDFGFSVSNAGDVNGDGVTDLIIGAINVNGYGLTEAGAAAIIFGKSGIGSHGTSYLNPTTLNGINGYIIAGAVKYAQAGWSVSGAGDINADGIDDLLIGAPQADSHGNTYVVFGQTSIVNGIFSLSTLNGNNGFYCVETTTSDLSGWVVNRAGDINADGVDDFLTLSNTGGATSAIIFGEKSSLFSLKNTLTIGESQSVILSSYFLNATNPLNPAIDSTIIITISNVQHGQFNLDSFSQQQVRTGQIQFTHDGSPWSPAYSVSLSYGKITATLPQAATITFQQSFVIVNNNILLNQGQIVILTSSNLSANDLDNSNNDPSLIFSIINPLFGYFSLVTAPTTAINSFTQQQVQNGDVQFVADGSSNTPSYQVQVINGIASISPQSSTVTFYATPVLVNNILQINQGQPLVLSSSNLNANDPNGRLFTLTFLVSNVQHGYFSFVNSPSIKISNFIQSQVQSGQVQFVPDGSTSAPSYSVVVSNGRISSASQSGVVVFTLIPSLVNNNLSIGQGQTVILTSSNLSAIDPNGNTANLIFIVSNIQHGHFALISNPSLSITTFTQGQIQSGEVELIADGSSNPLSYSIAVSNGKITLNAQAGAITFYPAPVLVNNNLIINQGQTITLTSNNLSASSTDDSATLTFTVSQIQHGYFSLVSSSTTPITSFTQNQIQSEAVLFTQDGSISSPSYTVSVSDGKITTGKQPPQIIFTSFNPTPVLTTNSLTIQQGQTVTLSSIDLSATDPDTAVGQLVFSASALSHGHFAQSNSPSTAVSSFIQQEITNGDIVFVADGSPNPPAYNITVSDGSFSSLPSPAIVNFTPNAASAAGTSSTIRNVIIGTTVSGAVGLLFFILKFYLSYRAERNLQKSLMGEGGEIQKQQALFHNTVILPITTEVFKRIKTTAICGYRSEEDTKAYLSAIENIIGKMVDLGFTFKEISTQKNKHLIDTIAQQIQQTLGKKYRCCTLGHFYSFFRMEVTAQQLDESADKIANAVYQTLTVKESERRIDVNNTVSSKF